MNPSQNISSKTLQSWLADGSAVLLDVREVSEYRQSHIQGSLNIPLASIRSQSFGCFEGKSIVFQCQSGRRSSLLLEHVQKNGDNPTLYHLQGGIHAWKQHGFDICEARTPEKMSLMRQAHIAAGFLVMLSSVLSFWLGLYFLLLSGFVGLGLLSSGLTGFCGMQILMAKMPWNQAKE